MGLTLSVMKIQVHQRLELGLTTHEKVGGNLLQSLQYSYFADQICNIKGKERSCKGMFSVTVKGEAASSLLGHECVKTACSPVSPPLSLSCTPVQCLNALLKSRVAIETPYLVVLTFEPPTKKEPGSLEYKQ